MDFLDEEPDPPRENRDALFGFLGSEPDLAQCEADATDMSGLACCQSPQRPETCPYAVRFGEGFLCTHPECERIVAQTRNKPPPARPQEGPG